MDFRTWGLNKEYMQIEPWKYNINPMQWLLWYRIGQDSAAEYSNSFQIIPAGWELGTMKRPRFKYPTSAP